MNPQLSLFPSHSIKLAPEPTKKKLHFIIYRKLSTRAVFHVVVDGVTSSTFITNAGVPQSSVWSATMFLLYKLNIQLQKRLYISLLILIGISTFDARGQQLEIWKDSNYKPRIDSTHYTTFSLKISCPQTGIRISRNNIVSLDSLWRFGVSAFSEKY